MTSQRLEPLSLNAVGPAFDENLLHTVYKEWIKEIGPISIENFERRIAADCTRAWINNRLKHGTVLNSVVEKRFCEGNDVAMRHWFALIFVWFTENVHSPSSQATNPQDR